MSEIVAPMEGLMMKSLSETFPDDIVSDILSRLPVKPIQRFKCASKSWCRLLNDPVFIRMHLNRALAKGDSPCLLLRHLSPEEKDSFQWMARKDALMLADGQPISPGQKKLFDENFSLRSNTTFEEIGKPHLPMDWSRRFTSIVGSGNGIVCIAETDNFVYSFEMDVALWNPATTEFRLLPELANGRSRSFVAALGFTFNRYLNDYKLVRIIAPSIYHTFEAQVFSVTANCWKPVRNDITRCDFLDFISKAIMYGIMHWLAFEPIQSGTQDFIILFDTTADRFGTMDLPENLTTKMKELVLQIYHVSPRVTDCLALFISDELGCDIWVMQEYGKAKSWTKLYSIPLELKMRPIGFFLDRQVLMGKLEEDTEEGDLYSCYPYKPVYRNLHARAPTCMVEYVETLMPIGGLEPLPRLTPPSPASSTGSSDYP